MEYETSHGRDCEIECENASVLDEVNHALQNRETYRNVPRPALITECTACPVRKGCVTEFVCHTTSVENAVKILRCGSLLSAIKARNLSVEELMAESRNAANDPADYFEYIMLAWGKFYQRLYVFLNHTKITDLLTISSAALRILFIRCTHAI